MGDAVLIVLWNVEALLQQPTHSRWRKGDLNMTGGLNELVTPTPTALRQLPHVSFGPLPPALTLGMLLDWQPQALGKGVPSRAGYIPFVQLFWAPGI